jgi:hypothetical protein
MSNIYINFIYINVKQLSLLTKYFNAKMVFTSEHRRFIIESYFRNSAFNNQDFFSDGNSSLEFGVHFCFDGNSCAGLKGLCPSPGIKYYADGNSCAPVCTNHFH